VPLHRAVSSIALVCLIAAATAGCSNKAGVGESINEGGWFSKPVDLFAKPDWARPAGEGKVGDLGPSGPVNPDNLVGGDGRCLGGSAPAAEAAAPVTAASAGGDPGAPQVMGGIGLGMSECDAVRRAGLPSNVSIGTDEKGERKVVLTYLGGTWPGIYTFTAGRLKAIDRAPEQPKPARPAPKKKPARAQAR
jgi:predicted small secreted protein